MPREVRQYDASAGTRELNLLNRGEGDWVGGGGAGGPAATGDGDELQFHPAWGVRGHGSEVCILKARV